MSSTATQPDAGLLGGVAVGGVVGSLGRYAVGLALPHPLGSFPWSTLVVNVTGGVAMGLLVAFLVPERLSLVLWIGTAVLAVVYAVDSVLGWRRAAAGRATLRTAAPVRTETS